MSFKINNQGIRFRESADASCKEMRTALRIYLGNNIPQAGREFILKGLFWLTAWGGFYSVFLDARQSWLHALLAALGAGLSGLFLALNVGHDAAHGTVFKNRKFNRLLHWWTFNFLGVSSYLWELRHNNSHHLFPNVNGCDADIDENPLLRLSPNHPAKPWHRFQHLYALPIYGLVHLHLFLIQDFLYLRKQRLANLINIRHNAFQIAGLILGKIQYLVLNLVVPYWLLPYSLLQICAIFMLVSAAMSIAFVLPLIGTHFNDYVKFPQADAQGRLPGSFTSHQLETCLDWGIDSRTAFWFFGGINAHTAHHIFPSVNHTHYPAATRIIREVLQRQGLVHRHVSLFEMIRSHFRFLKNPVYRPGSG